MSRSDLQVVFGTGQVGLVLANQLASSGNPVRSVSRHRPSALAEGVDWCAADASDPKAATEAARGASVIYQCLGAPYTQWPKQFPPLQRAVLSAAEHTDALLVSLENLYAYGPTGDAPMTEDLPLNATTSKGRVRAAMTAELLAAAERGQVRIAIGRASDFFGAGATESTLGARVFGNAVADNAPTSSEIPICPTPTATFPISRPAWLSWVLTSGRSGRCGISLGPRR